jgi:Glycosyltransferases involved in cell wall biogenesis
MDISIVVPLYNEEESLSELAAWINRVMTLHNLSHEVIMVDDGSSDQELGGYTRSSENSTPAH